jgi:hypothetical protein
MNSIGRHALRGYWILSAMVVVGANHLPAQDLPENSPRWRWFEENKDKVDIVFIGSSRIYHGISPKLFEQVAGQSGHRWRSFNLGVDKMRPVTCLALARRVLALRPRRMNYLFFELQTRAGWGTALPENATGRNKESFLSFGLIQAGVRQHPGGLGPEGDGFDPLDKNMTEQVRPLYEKRLRAVREHPRKRSMDPVMRGALSDLVRDLAAQNITAVFVVAPSLRAARGSGIDAPPGSLLFSFDDLVRYAPLYDEANRTDAEHLNVRGAAIFTRILAQEFVQALGSRTR